MTWTVIEHAYGDANRITGFRTKEQAVFYAQCTHCSEERPRKIVAGEYELLGKDLIVKEAEQ